MNKNNQTRKITPAKVYQLITFALLGLLIISTFMLQTFASKQKKEVATLNQELSDITIQLTGKQNLNRFLQQNKQTIDTVNSAFPNEDTIIDFIDAVEALITNVGATGSLSFSALVPGVLSDQLQIPFNITMEATPTQLADFLRRFEKFPYLIQISSISIKTPNGVQATTNISLGGRVYVQDPFTN